VADATVVENDVFEVAQRTPKQIAWGRFKRNRVGVISASVTIFFLSLSILAPLVTRIFGVNNKSRYGNTLNEFAMPTGHWGGVSLAHPLGVEPGTGRDVFALLVYGSRISFTVAVISTFASIAIGMLVGIATGYFKGKVDAIVLALL
jgi:peptide/nickel transport system permease protein